MVATQSAYAKINLFLDVIGRREDGFHNIFSVMQSVSLCDEISITAKKSDISSITLRCNDDDLSVGDDNLIMKAAKRYLEHNDIKAELDITLKKIIPIGAGLGGGSSDAAATLRALNNIFKASTKDELIEIASGLGSDVPFCLLGGRAICTGRGEKIEPIKDYLFNNIVVAIGKERVSTPAAYKALDEKYSDFDYGCYKPIQYSGQHYNIFESVINIAEIDNIKEIMTKNKAESSMMSGSGPSVFGIFTTADDAIHAEDELIKNGFFACYCHTVKGEL